MSTASRARLAPRIAVSPSPAEPPSRVGYDSAFAFAFAFAFKRTVGHAPGRYRTAVERRDRNPAQGPDL
jgi:hypothetical protein